MTMEGSYSDEFKREVARLAFRKGQTPESVAAKYKVTTEQVVLWKKQLLDGDLDTELKAAKAELEENRRKLEELNRAIEEKDRLLASLRGEGKK